jgi:hypothetical protein
MKKEQFDLGMRFCTKTGDEWKVTDIGSRTIVAIRITGEEPLNLLGPPYGVLEVVFDEFDIEECSPI